MVPEAPGGVWDLLVVGGGTAGLVGSRTAASLGASVLLVERDRPGGDCLWTGCVPSKALLAAAAAAAGARDARRLGIHVGPAQVAFGEVMAHVRAAIAAIEPVDSADAVRASGVAYAGGAARFTGPTTAEVDGIAVRFRQALVATGSEPVVPPELAGAAPLTSDTVWDLAELPARLVVVGGGATGCELGQAFARLGSAVTIVEAGEVLLGTEDPDAARLVTDALIADGVRVLTGTTVDAVDRTALILAGGHTVTADAVLAATGRRPRTAAMGLGAAGVRTDRRGFVVVDRALRTTNPRIWAAGDVTGHPQFTHVAGVHAATAAANAVLGLRRPAQSTALPRVTFTSPELAAVGRPAGSPGTSTATLRHDELDRAIAEGATAGFTRVVLDRRRRVVGATVVSPRAGEALAELTLAVRRGLRARDLAGVVHPYPTWGDGVWNLAVAHVRGRLGGPVARRVTHAVAGARRRRWDRRQ